MGDWRPKRSSETVLASGGLVNNAVTIHTFCGGKTPVCGSLKRVQVYISRSRSTRSKTFTSVTEFTRKAFQKVVHVVDAVKNMHSDTLLIYPFTLQHVHILLCCSLLDKLPVL